MFINQQRCFSLLVPVWLKSKWLIKSQGWRHSKARVCAPKASLAVFPRKENLKNATKFGWKVGSARIALDVSAHCATTLTDKTKRNPTTRKTSNKNTSLNLSEPHPNQRNGVATELYFLRKFLFRLPPPPPDLNRLFPPPLRPWRLPKFPPCLPALNFDENFPVGGEYICCPFPAFACFGPRGSSESPLENVIGAWRFAPGSGAFSSAATTAGSTLMVFLAFGVTQLRRTTDLKLGGEWKRSRISVWMFDVVFNPMTFNFSSSVLGSEAFFALMSSWSFLT